MGNPLKINGEYRQHRWGIRSTSLENPLEINSKLKGVHSILTGSPLGLHANPMGNPFRIHWGSIQTPSGIHSNAFQNPLEAIPTPIGNPCYSLIHWPQRMQIYPESNQNPVDSISKSIGDLFKTIWESVQNAWGIQSNSMGTWGAHSKFFQNHLQIQFVAMGNPLKIHGEPIQHQSGIHSTSLENPLEINSKFRGCHWTSMENPLGIHAKSMGNPCRITCESILNPSEIHSKAFRNPLETNSKSIGNTCYSHIQWSHVIHWSHAFHSSHVIHWSHGAKPTVAEIALDQQV